MLQTLSIKLLSSASKITYYAFDKMPIIPKIMPLILIKISNGLASDSFFFHLIGCCIKIFCLVCDCCIRVILLQ